jgi:hypothetical protein
MVVTIHQTCASESTLLRWLQYFVQRLQEFGIRGRYEEDEWRNQYRRVKDLVSLVTLDEAFQLLIVALVMNSSKVSLCLICYCMGSSYLLHRFRREPDTTPHGEDRESFFYLPSAARDPEQPKA